MAKNARPMLVRASSSGQISSRLAWRNRIAWDRLTKWVEGDTCITHCSQVGMLSSGVVPPESSSIGIITGMLSRPNCGIERARVARKIPSAVLANRYSAVTARNSGCGPASGTPIKPLTTNSSDTQVQSTTTRALLRIFASMISSAVSGSTSR